MSFARSSPRAVALLSVLVVSAGAQVIMPPTDMFWGDRYSKLKDPYGHEWSIATHIQDLTPEEMAKGAAAAFGGEGGSP